MKKTGLILLLLILGTFNLSFAKVTVVKNAEAELWSDRVLALSKTIINNPNDTKSIEKYIKTMSARSIYYSKVKKDLEKSSDDLRSALYFLSADKGSEKYKSFKTRLDKNLTLMKYYPTTSDSLELAKNLYLEGKYFASAYEFQNLADLAYEKAICWEYLGDIAQKLSDNKKAINYYMRSLNAYPENDLVLFKLAGLYKQMGENDLAQNKYREIVSFSKNFEILSSIINLYTQKLTKEPENANYHEIIGLAYRQLGDYKNADIFLAKAIYLNPKDIFLKYSLASLYFENGQMQKAIDIYNSILSDNPYDTQIRVAKGKCLLKLNKKNEALREFQIVLMLYPTSKQAQYGIFKLYKGESFDVIAKKIYYANPNFAPDDNFYYELGEYSKGINKADDAVLFYNKALFLNPKNAKAYVGLFYIYELGGNKARAKDVIKTAYKNVPSNKEILEIYSGLNTNFVQKETEIALDCIKNNEWAHAIKIYENIEPKTVEIYASISNCYKVLKDYKNAKIALEKAKAIEPSNSDIYYNLALLYLEQNSPKSAKENLKKAVSLNKNNLKAQKLLNSINNNEVSKILDEAYGYYEKGNYAKSLEILTKGTEIYKSSLQLYYYRGLTYYAMNDYEKAIFDFHKVISIDNTFDPVYYTLGELLEKYGREKEALHAYERYLSGEPQDTARVKKAQQRAIELGNKFY